MSVFRFAACVAHVSYLLVTGVAWAQESGVHESTPSKTSFEGEAEWRSLFAQAKSAFAEHRFAEAKGLLRTAAEIKMTPKIAANLAQVEVQLGEYRAAANHAAEALSALGSNEGVEADLAVASKHVSKLMVTTNQPEARVTIDGEVVGMTPMQHAIYVDVGSHVIGVDKPGYARTIKEISAAPASEQLIAFELSNEPPAIAAPQPPEVAASAASVTPQPASVPQRVAPEPEPEPHSGSARTLLLVAGGVLTTAGVATGLVFNAKAHRNERDAEKLSMRLGSDGCVDPVGNYGAQCAQLLDDRRSHDHARNLSTAGFITGGVALAATLVVVAWPRSKSSAGATASNALRLQGSAAPGASWLFVSGGF